MRSSVRKSFHSLRFVFIAFALILPLIGSSFVGSFAGPVSVALGQDDPESAIAMQDDGSPVPDSDGDGIADDMDECPTDPSNTCNLPPDSDGDGITDDQDECIDDPSNTCNLEIDIDDGDVTDTCPSDAIDDCVPLPEIDEDNGAPTIADDCVDDPSEGCEPATPSSTPTAIGTPDAVVEAAASSYYSVGGRFWYDTNNNGVQDSGEANASGVRFSIGWCPDEYCDYIKDIVTDSNGNYSVTGLTPGKRYVLVPPITGHWTVKARSNSTETISLDSFGGLEFKRSKSGSNQAGSGKTDISGLNLRIVVISNGNKVKTTTGNLRMRSGAGTNYSVLHTLSAGTQCTIVGGPSIATGYHWYRVDCGSGRIGWVAGDYLTPSSSSSSAPTNPPPSTGGFAANSKVKTTASNLKMRSGAGTNNSVLHTLSSGVQCTVLSGPISATNYQWYRLDCGSSRIGWVAGSYLKLVSAAPANPTKTPVPSTGGFAANSKVQTTASNLKMRSGAGTNNSVLHTLSSGVQCTVLSGPISATNYQWYRLDCGSSRVGWVAGSYLKLSSTTTAPSTSGFAVNSKVKTTASNLKMRSGAGTNNSVLYTLSSGVQCKVLGGPTSATGYQWYRLDCGSSRVGWVAGSYLKKA